MSFWDTFKAHGYYAKHAAILTLIMGMYLHTTSLLIGRDLFLEYVLTPQFDMVLAIPMTYAGIFGWLAWKQVVFDHTWKKVFYAFIMAYFTISIPIHIRTFVTQSTEYIRAFPEWYSFVVLVMMTAMLLFMWNLKYELKNHKL